MRPARHPAKVLANYLLQHWTELPHSLRSYPELPLSCKKSYPVQLTAAHEENLEDVISHLDGHVEHQTLKQKDLVSIYPLKNHGEEAITLTLAPSWLAALFRSGRIQYFELDTSFYALRPST
jgi:uncharacterized protein HemY